MQMDYLMMLRCHQASKPSNLIGKEQQQAFQLAAQSAAQSAVLLKKSATIALDSNRKLLVIGTAAERLSDQTGAYSLAITSSFADATAASQTRKAYKQQLNLVQALENNSDNLTYINATELNPQLALRDAQKLYERLQRVKKPPKRLKKAFDGKVNLVEGLTAKDSQLFLKKYSLRVNRFMQDYDSIVVVISEPAYATGSGDKKTLSPSFALQQQLNFLYSVRNQKSRLAVIMYAGRPSYMHWLLT